MCDIGEPDDYCQVWQWAKVNAAKKPHVCDSCSGPIAPGESYFRFRSLFDGYWTAEKQCATCDRDATAFQDAHGGIDLAPSAFADHLIECVNEEDPEDAKWRAMLEALQARGRREAGARRMSNPYGNAFAVARWLLLAALLAALGLGFVVGRWARG